MDTVDVSNLDRIEELTYQAIWEDGLIDIFVGLALFLIGVIWIVLDSVYGSMVAPILVPLWVVARKRISEPRMGIVSFSADRVARNNKSLLGLFLFGVLAFAIAVIGYFVVRQDSFFAALRIADIVAGLPAVLLALPAIIVAFAFGLKRFLIYAAVLLISAIAVVFLVLEPGWAFVPSGVWCIGAGSRLLRRFVQTYPLAKSL